MSKHPIRADEYRARAAAEAEAGAASPLEQVRTKHARAAQVWADMALAEEARGTERAARAALAALRV
jgi:hypothetical protein